MQNIDTIKRYSDELAKILTLSELINNYLAASKPSPGKAVKKQSDRALTSLLRKEYTLSDNDMSDILATVQGKKKTGKKGKGTGFTTASADELQKQVDGAIAEMGISVRDHTKLTYEQYLRKIKSNLSVRKVKAMQVLDLNQGRKNASKGKKKA